MGLEFLKQHGARRTTGYKAEGNPFAGMQLDHLLEWATLYEQMLATGRTRTNLPLTESERSDIRKNLSMMREEIARRDV